MTISFEQIAEDVFGHVKVSTIYFLGKYETMVVGGEHDDYQARYLTREDAVKGHQQTVEMVTASADGVR